MPDPSPYPIVRLSTVLLAALAGLALIVITAAPVEAHAELVTASPPPGSGLPQAPGAVELRFNEPLNFSLSRMRILNSEGVDVGASDTQKVRGDPHAMRRRLGVLPPDKYRVEWTTVSTIDGHSLHGSYSFGIGMASEGNEELRAGPVDSEGWLGLIGRFLALSGLALWGGSALLTRPSQGLDLKSRRLQQLWVAGPLLAFFGVALSVTATAVIATGSPLAVGDVLFGGRSGLWRLTVMVASALAALIGTGRTTARGLLAVIAIVAEAASGHAASSTNPSAATLLFAVHLGAAGVWTFAIVVSLMAADRLRSALQEFTPYAVGAGVVVAITGVANAVIVLERPNDLISTAYGRVVALKAGALAVMALLGLAHYRLRRGGGRWTVSLRAAVTGELIAAAIALALATTLVGFPNPPGEAESNGHVGFPALAALAGTDDLSLAQASGPFIVGLTVTPPEPGPVLLRVDVLGVKGGDRLRDSTLVATSEQGSRLHAPLRSCGLGCFLGEGVIDAEGDWTFRVSLASNRGPLELKETVHLPTADASDELEEAVAAMEQLGSARMQETVSGSVEGPQVVSDYVFEAPDKMTIAINETRQIIIGQRRFRKDGPDAEWTEGTWPGKGFTWPKDYFESFWRDPVAVRMLGTTEIEGTTYEVIGFLRPDLPAWFRLFVHPSTKLIRTQQMRAEGHIMDHTYRDYGAPTEIRPPDSVK